MDLSALTCELVSNPNSYPNGFQLDFVRITNTGQQALGSWQASLNLSTMVKVNDVRGRDKDRISTMVNGNILTFFGTNLDAGETLEFGVGVTHMEPMAIQIPQCFPGDGSNGGGMSSSSSSSGGKPVDPIPLPYGDGEIAKGLCSANTGLGSGEASRAAGVVFADGTAAIIEGTTVQEIKNGDNIVNNVKAISNRSYDGNFCLATNGGDIHCGRGSSIFSTNVYSGDVLSISSSHNGNNFCALLKNGDVACGNDTGFSKVDTGSNSPMAQFWCGRDNECCGVDDNGDVVCFSALNGGKSPRTPTVKPDKAVMASMGQSNGNDKDGLSCAVYENSAAYCWDSANSFGDLGIPQSVLGTGQAEPEMATFPAGAVHVSAGQWFTCWTLHDGSVQCSGGNSNQNGAGGGKTTLTQIEKEDGGFLDEALAVTTGREFSCAVRKDGSLYCWGGGSTKAKEIMLKGKKVKVPGGCD